MDFITTARLLMGIQKDHPAMDYTFNELTGKVEISIPVQTEVAGMFHQGAQMFS